MSAPIIQTVRRLTPPTRHSDVICWEALNPQDKALREARRLYRASLPAEERIPWRWIKRQVAGRVRWRYGEWQPHLLLARLHRRPAVGSPVVGFTYGAHVPGFGGYMGYIAVSQEQRGQGIAGRLLRLLIQHLQIDAASAGVSLPFVVWESRCPRQGSTQQEWDVWNARVRLFERVGAHLVDGMEFLAPNFAEPGGAPVPLRLFVVPVDRPAADFNAEALWELAEGLRDSVYLATEVRVNQDADGVVRCGPALLADGTPALRPRTHEVPPPRPPEKGRPTAQIA